MVYFDRLHQEHFGTIRQQLWSTFHFLLHTTLVLVLQGVSMLVLWLVALQGLEGAEYRFHGIQDKALGTLYKNGTELVGDLRYQIDSFVWKRVPKGVDASQGLDYWNNTLVSLGKQYNTYQSDSGNVSAKDAVLTTMKKLETIAIQSLFDSLAISVPKEEDAESTKGKAFDKDALLMKYEERFKLVFDYVYIAVSSAHSLNVVAHHSDHLKL